MATWLIATVVGVVLALVAGVGWIVFLRSDSGAGVVDTRCSGSTRIDIAAGGAAAGLAQVAAAFNATAPEARGSCLTAQVNAVASAQAAAALPAGWSGQATPPPAVWIPDNPADLASVATAAPALVAGYNDTVIATSPVVLAVAGGDAPTTFPSWANLLVALAAGDAPPLADGEPLRLALGDPRLDPATGYALESMIAGGPTAVTAESVAGATDALRSVAGRAAVSSSAADLLDDLAGGNPTFSAVPALEATVAAYNAAAADPLTVIRPDGPTAGDELTAVTLAADWVDVTETEGAAAFIAFLRSPAAATLLQQAGWRVPGAAGPATAGPTPGTGVDTTVPVTALPPSDLTVADALATALGLPAAPLGTGAVPDTAGSTAPSTG
ncbi:substrate-binding domain-containing protein [Nakamurella deserti]|uniref:substrate-binding domain-containing protein n=1 Tax=Nakamurella deserti TaxID=2164074 RepID=UPI0013004B95|nr:substrate-binding domain-containing protein [Nakamurella deserti]